MIRSELFQASIPTDFFLLLFGGYHIGWRELMLSYALRVSNSLGRATQQLSDLVRPRTVKVLVVWLAWIGGGDSYSNTVTQSKGLWSRPSQSSWSFRQGQEVSRWRECGWSCQTRLMSDARQGACLMPGRACVSRNARHVLSKR